MPNKVQEVKKSQGSRSQEVAGFKKSRSCRVQEVKKLQGSRSDNSCRTLLRRAQRKRSQTRFALRRSPPYSKSDVSRSKPKCSSPMADLHRRGTSNFPHTSFNSLKRSIRRPTPNRPSTPWTQSTGHWALAPVSPAERHRACRQGPTSICVAS